MRLVKFFTGRETSLTGYLKGLLLIADRNGGFNTEPALTITGTKAPMMADKILANHGGETVTGCVFFCVLNLVII